MSWGSRSKRIHGLYAIADSEWNPYPSIPELVHAFLRGGCRLVQLRMKGRAPDEISTVARDILRLKREYDFTFLLNDTPEIAAQVGANGVHVGLDDMPIGEIRSRYGDRLIVGFSASKAPERATEAIAAGADYIAFGAIYPTRTRGLEHPIQGVERLRAFVQATPVPVVAIGGINRGNLAEVLHAGPAAVAMITGLSQARDVEAATRWFVEAIRNDGKREGGPGHCRG